jgi:hypothetical protein
LRLSFVPVAYADLNKVESMLLKSSDRYKVLRPEIVPGSADHIAQHSIRSARGVWAIESSSWRPRRAGNHEPSRVPRVRRPRLHCPCEGQRGGCWRSALRRLRRSERPAGFRSRARLPAHAGKRQLPNTLRRSFASACWTTAAPRPAQVTVCPPCRNVGSQAPKGTRLPAHAGKRRLRRCPSRSLPAHAGKRRLPRTPKAPFANVCSKTAAPTRPQGPRPYARRTDSRRTVNARRLRRGRGAAG